MTEDSPARVRLHITPFNPSLYPTIINKTIHPHVTNLSYHTVQTDPDHGFGYVELPKPEADKLRQKLNGALLRGAKMKIETAKPEKRKRVSEAEEEANRQDGDREQDKKEKKKVKKVKKSKLKDGEFAGFELPEGRSVKRGWTEEAGKSSGGAGTSKRRNDDDDKKDKKKKKQEKSKFTSGKELLFKTKLPEKAKAAMSAEDDKKKAKKEEKKEKKKSRTGPVVIHEFEKNTQYPSFLRQESTKKNVGIATEFVQGKGWVDADGNVVEAVAARPNREARLAAMSQNDADEVAEYYARTSRRETVAPSAAAPPAVDLAVNPTPLREEPVVDENTRAKLAKFDQMLDDDESGSEENFRDAASEHESESESEPEPESNEPASISGQEHQVETVVEQVEDDADSSSSSSDSEESISDSDSESELEKEQLEKEEDKDKPTTPEPSQAPAPSESTATAKSSSPSAEQEPQPAPERKEIHPLEALYKRAPKPNDGGNGTPKPSAINTSFSFFGGNNDEDSESGSVYNERHATMTGGEEGGEAEEEDPRTPYSSHDGWGAGGNRGRRSRSAAPTPDTAAIGKRFSFAFGENDGYDEEGEEDDDDDDMAAVNYMPVTSRQTSFGAAAGDEEKAGAEGGGESAFAKWFWEKRGDSNRAWKKRRRDVMKVHRQRENRRVGRRMV